MICSDDKASHTHSTWTDASHTASITTYSDTDISDKKATTQLQTLRLLEQTSTRAMKWISVIYQSTVDIDNSKIPE